jgi:hypothetical protein
VPSDGAAIEAPAVAIKAAARETMVPWDVDGSSAE